MQRTYELAMVFDPDLSDEDQVKLIDDYKKMITDSGVEVVKEESWGKKRLAYEIARATEGKYHFLYLSAEEGSVPPVRELETRFNQNEQVLRYLVVRTDEDLKRALAKGKKHVPAAEPFGFEQPETAKKEA